MRMTWLSPPQAAFGLLKRQAAARILVGKQRQLLMVPLVVLDMPAEAVMAWLSN
jgi:hypothetical protein